MVTKFGNFFAARAVENSNKLKKKRKFKCSYTYHAVPNKCYLEVMSIASCIDIYR